MTELAGFAARQTTPTRSESGCVEDSALIGGVY
jgi:hypothetical protein